MYDFMSSSFNFLDKSTTTYKKTRALTKCLYCDAYLGEPYFSRDPLYVSCLYHDNVKITELISYNRNNFINGIFTSVHTKYLDNVMYVQLSLQNNSVSHLYDLYVYKNGSLIATSREKDNIIQTMKMLFRNFSPKDMFDNFETAEVLY